MYNLGEIDKTVQVDVQIDIEDVLDDLDTDDIEEYLAERYKEERKSDKNVDDEDIKGTLIDLCVGRCRRNFEEDKEEVKATILKLIDEVFI